ncbi:MAG: hypothetical protein ACLR8Y_04640 [Alistipes indistinctus]
MMQTLPQLKAHAAAALLGGCHARRTARQSISAHCLVGFPKTLNAVSVVNEVFRERGISAVGSTGDGYRGGSLPAGGDHPTSALWR